MMKQFFIEWYHRLQSDTPKFFQKIATIGTSLAAIGAALMAAPANVHLPDAITRIDGYLLTAGFIMTVVAKSACTNNPNK